MTRDRRQRADGTTAPDELYRPPPHGRIARLRAALDAAERSGDSALADRLRAELEGILEGR